MVLCVALWNASAGGTCTHIKFYMPNENIHLKGTVSQNFYIGPISYFMTCRKNN